MKLQIFLLSVLLVSSAFAHPVPDEEVSSVKSEVKSDVKPEVVEIPVKKAVESVKSETRATEKLKQPVEEPIKEKVLLAESAPDAEIAQTISEKKDEKLPLAVTEKQTRAENKPVVVVAKSSGDVKSLPVVEGPVAGIEAEKQNVAEEKPAVAQEIAPKQIAQETLVQPESKADLAAAPATVEIPIAEAPASEQKKDELSAIETAPAVKTDTPSPAAPIAIEQPAEKPIASAEEKKEEQAARQERGNEQEAANKPVEAKPAAEAQTAEAQIKTLKNEDPKPAAAAAAAPTPALAIEQPAKIAEKELKSLTAEKPIVFTPAAPAGDIPAPVAPIDAATEESNLKDLKLAETKQVEKQEEPLVLAAAPAAAAEAAPLPAAKQIAEPALAAAATAAEQQAELALKEPEQPLKKLEELPVAVPLADKKLEEKKLDEKKLDEKKLVEKKPLSDEKKSEESKESKESESESKESGESKEDKSN